VEGLGDLHGDGGPLQEEQVGGKEGGADGKEVVPALPGEMLFGLSDNPEKGEHVDELALLLGHEHGGRLRVVHGDMLVHKKHSGKANLYIS
jgi:hypothetical protein